MEFLYTIISIFEYLGDRMKERLDIILVQDGYFDTREKAKRAIMAGIVLVDDKKIDKAGTIINLDKNPQIRIKGEKLKYVSRGGLKLEKAINIFNIDFLGKRVLDIGASTGGFTDCVLQNEAKYIYAVDVGTNQLAYTLRENEKVKSIENMHIKNLTLENLDNEKVDIIVMDVSFISITKIIPDLKNFLKDTGEMMILIKPQFEVGKEGIDKGGIVKDLKKHKNVIEEIIKFTQSYGFYLKGLSVSPITGTKGNIEYISHFINEEIYDTIKLDEIIEQARFLREENK